ncbi:MAG: rRNA pseudouridine synthase [Syntrophomonadaceae bacterium]|jgi:23S rRNA pseudouridine2605 synthase|nr:rRNA pseudouridine synthase [Syntrophomonadaceae bacterium]
MRLTKYIADSGIASRRRAEELIASGMVAVNGVTVTTVGVNVDPLHDKVSVNGRLIKPRARVYLLLNKPGGYLSSVKDPHGRPTVVDLLKDVDERVYPVGRLDLDTEGLLILTNDGEFMNLMTHPRYHIPKTYQAWVKGIIDDKDLKALGHGIELEEGMTAPASARMLRINNGCSLIELVLYEGRKRQVKRMLKAIGHPVLALKRTALGFLTLQGLAPGEYRHLLPEEVKKLTAMARGS